MDDTVTESLFIFYVHCPVWQFDWILTSLALHTVQKHSVEIGAKAISRYNSVWNLRRYLVSYLSVLRGVQAKYSMNKQEVNMC